MNITLKPEQVVYTKLNHVARSGMSRSVSLYIIEENELLNITYHTAQALGHKLDKFGGIRVSGYGFDAGFELVYRLGLVTWPEGTPEPHGTRNGVPDNNGGYALTQRWL